jgi:hypothetical protein
MTVFLLSPKKNPSSSRCGFPTHYRYAMKGTVGISMIPIVRGWTSPDQSDPGPSPTTDRTSTAKNEAVVQFRPV